MLTVFDDAMPLIDDERESHTMGCLSMVRSFGSWNGIDVSRRVVDIYQGNVSE